MELSKLTAFALFVNGALGSGRYNDITTLEVKFELERNNLFPFLKNKLGIDVDISYFNEEEKRELTEEWWDMSVAIDEGRKLCVEKNGLALITAYILESILRKSRKQELALLQINKN